MNLPVSAPSTVEADAELQRVRDLTTHRRHLEALAAAEQLAQRVPGNRDALYLMALNQRQLNRIPDALRTLEQLETLHPRFSRLYQERGHCRVVQRDAPGAIDAFLRAVNLNPALPASWSMLERLYRLQRQDADASTAAQHVATLQRLPPAVIQATSLLSDGELGPAEKIIRAFLLEHVDDVEAMRVLAKIARAYEVLDEAELLLDTILTLAPDYRAARRDYALVLIERHKHRQALEQLQLLLRDEPQDRLLRALYATACAGLGEHTEAISRYRELLAEAPNAEDLHLSLAHTLKAVGRTDEAIGAYRGAAAVRADFGDAYWSLANLKTYRYTDEELARIRASEAQATTAVVDRYHLCFALGKAYEDRADYAQSWHFYQRGNALKRAASRYRPEILENNTRLQIQTCTRDFFQARTAWGCQQADPIFIVGLPRSGSTLLEQILASHSEVEGTQELSDIQRIVLDLQGSHPDVDHPRYPANLTSLSAADVLRLGEQYLADTRAYRTSGKRLFIDKNPNNFRHIGLIHLILPNARIIDARREPMACCFSNLKQLFATGQEFTYSVADIARYYRTYLELMEHWNRVLPGRVLRVLHEEVVADLAGSVSRMLDFCGLGFEPACVEFYRTQRSVLTPSSEQVRQPIFREGLDQWRHYEPWLDPLKDALGDALVRYRN